MDLGLEYILSQVFVIISYLLLMLSYQAKSRKNILILSNISLVANGISYVFLQAYTGLAMCFVATFRNIIFLIDEKINGKTEKIEKKDIVILAILYLISVISTIFTYDGILSLIPVVITMIYTYSVWQKKTTVYKLLGLPMGILWITYNIYIMSLFGIILESILTISAIYGYYKEKRKNKN